MVISWSDAMFTQSFLMTLTHHQNFKNLWLQKIGGDFWWVIFMSIILCDKILSLLIFAITIFATPLIRQVSCASQTENSIATLVGMLLTCCRHVLMLARCHKILKLIWMSTTWSNFLFWITCLWHVVVTNREWAWTCWQKIYLRENIFLMHKWYCISSIYLQSKNSKKKYTFKCSFN